MAEQQRPKKGAFWRFWPKFEIPKNGSTDERTREGKRFLALAVCSGEQHGFSGSCGAAAAPKRSVLVFLTKIRDSKKWFYGRTNESMKTVPSPGSLQWWAALACTIAAWIFGKLAEWEQKISLMRLVLLDKNCTQQNGILGEQKRLEEWFAYLATLTRKTNWTVVEQHGLVHKWRSSGGPKKERFGVFDQNSRFQKNGSTDERTRAGKRFLALTVCSGEQHWPVL